MGEEGIKTRKRQRALESGNLVPVTLRLTAQDRDHMERVARHHGASLSEYLRDIIEDHGTRSSLGQRLEQMEVQLGDLVKNMNADRREQQQIGERFTQELATMRAHVADTSTGVEQFTTLIQTSFEQLFEAFFKLQSYIEHVLKAQGGRK